MKFKYIGTGAFIPGVPARDLTDADFQSLSEELQDAVSQSGLYSIANSKKSDSTAVKELLNDDPEQ